MGDHYNKAPSAIGVGSTFGTLLQGVIDTIAALEKFRAVIAFLNPELVQVPSCPAVCVWPSDDPIEDRGMSNVSIWTEYTFELSLILQGQDTFTMTATMLKAREILTAAFPDTLINLGDIAGHFQTQIRKTSLRPPVNVEGGAVLFDTGLVVACMVQE